jgi:hypothetical protein
MMVGRTSIWGLVSIRKRGLLIVCPDPFLLIPYRFVDPQVDSAQG